MWRTKAQLLVCSLLLALKAQNLHKLGFDELLDRMTSTPHLPSQADIEQARQIVDLACRLVGRLGMLNSCIVRSLVLGALLSDQDNSFLHIGFRAKQNQPTEGHAWITVKGRTIEFFAGESTEIQTYSVTNTFELSRRNRR